jgi:CelD/BcsL family acetyltransferase involved in cellulose biosynthesis
MTALSAIAEDWRALAARAAEPNVFYEPAFALAGAPAFGVDAGAVLAWTAGGRLVGLFPLRLARRRYGVPFPVLTAWTHPFAPLGTPLVDRDFTLPAIAAFLDDIARRHAPAPPLLMPFFGEDGEVAMALEAALALRQSRQAAFDPHLRALLIPDAVRGREARQPIDRKKRKEYARQRRRLADKGTLAFDLATTPRAIELALPEFLALEASGWKGRAGSAAAQTPGLQNFVQAAVSGLAAEGKARIARLTLNGRAVASAIVLTSGAGAWFWKTAYDETHARASPGVLATLDVSEALKHDTGLAFVDSCATSDHPMIDHLWRDRRRLSDRLIALAPGVRFDLACRLETLRRNAIAAGKRMHTWLGR